MNQNILYLCLLGLCIFSILLILNHVESKSKETKFREKNFNELIKGSENDKINAQFSATEIHIDFVDASNLPIHLKGPMMINVTIYNDTIETQPFNK